MRLRVEDALQEALEARRRGQATEALLAAWPADIADEVRRLLGTAAEISEVSGLEPPPGALRRSRVRFLHHAEGLRRRRGGLALAPRLALAALAAALALVVGVGGLSRAAANSLPGDPLYPVRIAAEDMRVRLAVDRDQRRQLQSTYEAREADDVTRLLALKRLARVSFHGLVRSANSPLWDVAGIPVRVSDDTRLIGEILPGTTVRVTGLSQADGEVLAEELRLDAYDVTGILKNLTADSLVVGDQTYALTGDSVVDPRLTPGDLAQLRVGVQDDGRLVVLSATRLAIPTVTPAPTATERREPTEARESPKPSETPEPTESHDHESSEQDTPEVKPTKTESEAETEKSSPTESETKQSFSGVVQAIDGSQWTIDGRTVFLDGETELEDDPQVGDSVRVVAILQPDGKWWAEKIKRDD